MGNDFLSQLILKALNTDLMDLINQKIFISRSYTEEGILFIQSYSANYKFPHHRDDIPGVQNI